MRYVRNVDAAARARLVEDHVDLARRAASIVFPRVKDHVEFEELVAIATTGLVEAAQRFDPERGASFNTFAWYRVQGAILDGLRRATQLPKRTWAKLVALRAASEYLEHRSDRDAGAAQRGVPPAQGADALAAIKQAMSAIRTMYVTSLEGMRDKGFDPAVDAAPPDERLDTQRLSSKLRDAIAALPDRERELMTKHYWEGKNLLEAGAELGISKSWACRLHAQAVDRLRNLVDAET
jgi:RNA polymerase sigma factor for flagellar operon FliA